MIRSLNTAEKAMQMEQVRIDALANNLANVDSTGFRQILTRVVEKGAPDGPVADAELTVAAAAAGRGTAARRTADVPDTLVTHAMDPRRGPVVATGRDTDVAIMGRGFFVVQTDAGERYTRAGSFVLDSQRRLTTPEGNVVLGAAGPVNLDGRTFAIGHDGTVTVDGQVRDRLRLVDFADPTRLEHEGANRLKAPEGLEPQDVPVPEVVVAQGHREGSNVDPVDVLVDMISAQRAFEMHTKVMTTEDELLNKSVNTLGRAAAS